LPKKRPSLHHLLKNKEYDSLTLGFVFPVSIMVGLGIGYLMDRILKTSPVFTVIFLFYGIIAGFVSFTRIVRKNEKKK